MSRARATRRHLAAAAAMAGLVVLTAGAVTAPAHATGLNGTPPAPAPAPAPAAEPAAETGTLPQTSTGDSSGSGGTVTGTVSSCAVVSSPSYLGLSCGSATGDALSVKEILGKDPVPDCWNERLTPSELDAMGLSNTEGPDGSTWFWERCLKGINPKTKQIGPDGVSFEVGIVSIENGGTVVTLTANQQQLVQFQGVEQMIPSPVAAVSPSAYPRVGQDVSFYLGSDDEVSAAAGAVLLRARVTSLEVRPLGADEATTVTCPGTGYRARREDTPRDAPEACWYRYLASSAQEQDQKYPVEMTARWEVGVSQNGAAGPFAPFNSFEKSQVTNLPVTEIQSIVIR